MTNSAWAKH